MRISSLHGSLKHVTFIFREGWSILPPLSLFISRFFNDLFLRHALCSVFDSTRWWKSVLSTPGGSCSLVPHCAIDPGIWVNASSSWGIGLVMKEYWSAWHL